MPESNKNGNLYEISGVEIFAAGTWNGDLYSNDDLDEMVKAFNENRGKIRPYLKLGHNDEQQLLQKDGLPAAGWISNVYRAGDKLMADFAEIPEKIYQLIKNKAYRKVSAEIYWNLTINDRKYPYFLSAVALLGSDIPAVGNLDDILNLYGLQDYESIKRYAKIETDVIVKRYEFKKDVASGGQNMPQENKEIEDQLKANQEKLDALSAEIKSYKAEAGKVAQYKSQVDELNTKLEESQKLIKALEVANNQAEVEKFSQELVSEKLASKSMLPMIQELVGPDKKEYSLGDKKLDKKSLLKEFLKLYKETAKVNFSESTLDTDLQLKNTEDAEVQKVREYAQKNNVSFIEAYKIVKPQTPNFTKKVD